MKEYVDNKRKRYMEVFGWDRESAFGCIITTPIPTMGEMFPGCKYE